MRQRVDFYCRIDASAFASILLVLLLMLEATLPGFHSDFGHMVELARSFHRVDMPNALREDALQVSISASGDVFFRNVRIHHGELANKIRDGLREGAEKKVYVIADARAWYADIRPVLAEISLEGIEKIGFITR